MYIYVYEFSLLNYLLYPWKPFLKTYVGTHIFISNHKKLQYCFTFLLFIKFIHLANHGRVLSAGSKALFQDPRKKKPFRLLIKEVVLEQEEDWWLSNNLLLCMKWFKFTKCCVNIFIVSRDFQLEHFLFSNTFLVDWLVSKLLYDLFHSQILYFRAFFLKSAFSSKSLRSKLMLLEYSI